MLKIYKICACASVLASFVFGMERGYPGFRGTAQQFGEGHRRQLPTPQVHEEQGARQRAGANPLEPGRNVQDAVPSAPNKTLELISGFMKDLLAGTFGGVSFSAGGVFENTAILIQPDVNPKFSTFLITLLSVLVSGAGSICLLLFCPPTIIGGLIAAGIMLFGGTIIEWATKKAIAWGENKTLEDSFSILNVFGRHIGKSMGIGLSIFLTTIPWAIISALAVYSVISLGIWGINGFELDPKYLAYIAPVFGALSFWLLSGFTSLGILVTGVMLAALSCLMIISGDQNREDIASSIVFGIFSVLYILAWFFIPKSNLSITSSIIVLQILNVGCSFFGNADNITEFKK